MTIRKTGDWRRAGRTVRGLAPRVSRAMDKATLQEGQFLRNQIVRGIRKQAPGGKKFKPLSRTTLAVRRFLGFAGRKALIRTASFLNSIRVIQRGGAVFVGVLRGSKSKDGEDLVKIAEIHEFGAGPFAMELTPKARRFLMAALAKFGPRRRRGFPSAPLSRGAKRILIIRIPARPYLQPVFDKEYSNREKVRRRFLSRVSKNLGGRLGRISGASPRR